MYVSRENVYVYKFQRATREGCTNYYSVLSRVFRELMKCLSATRDG